MRRERRVLFTVAVAALGLAGAGGCQAVLGLGDLSPADAAAIDTGANDAQVVDAASDVKRIPADAGCPAVYVSNAPGSKASDGNTGCDQSRPLLTIAHALQVVPVGSEVHVCTGTYVERDLADTTSTPIRGAYDCNTWTRPSGWGYPGFASVTVVSPSPQNSSTNTLVIGPTKAPVDAGAPGPAFVIDGLQVSGPTATLQSTAILVRNGANPTLRDDQVFGSVLSQAGPTAGFAAGITISAASPEVTNCVVSFPSTISTTPAVGISITNNDAVTGEVAFIHDSRIAGGNGTSSSAGPGSAGSVGLAVVSSASTAPMDATVARSGGATVIHNTINPGTIQGFSSLAKNTAASVGVIAYGPVTLDLEQNIIYGGNGSDTADAGTTAAIGVNVTSSAVARIVANRIYGGTEEQGSGGTYGIYVGGTDNATIVNNVVHGGGAQSTFPVVRSRAIQLNGFDGGVIEDNTLFAGSAPTGSTSAGYKVALWLSSGRNAVVRGNVVADLASTSGTVSNQALSFDDCANVSTMTNNLIVSQSNRVATIGHCARDAGPVGAAGTMKGFQAVYADPGVSQNTLLAENCTPGDLDAGVCEPDCPQGGCLLWLLAGYNTTTFQSGAFSDAGWALNPGLPCAVVHGGIDLSNPTVGPTITGDILDASRPLDGSSPGATQFSGACQ